MSNYDETALYDRGEAARKPYFVLFFLDEFFLKLAAGILHFLVISFFIQGCVPHHVFNTAINFGGD